MSSRARRPATRLLSRAVAPSALVVLVALAAGCGHSPIPMMGDYPPVEVSAGTQLVARGDTLWSDAVGPVALVTRDRSLLGRAWPELSGGVRAHQRMFGAEPAPVTVLLVPLMLRGRPSAEQDSAAARQVRGMPALLPDSLARRALVWYATPPDRRQRGDMGPGATGDLDELRLAMRWSPLGPQVAQQWIAARTGGSADAVPPWLHAGLVAVLGGGGDLRVPRGLLERRGRDLMPLDSLFARRCEGGWRPVRALDPAEPMPTRDQLRADRRDRVARDRDDRGGRREGPARADDAERADRDARCGPRFQSQALSVTAFMLQRAGDQFADVLLRSALRGEPVERALAQSAQGGQSAGRGGLPPTVRELEVAWRAWLREQLEGAR